MPTLAASLIALALGLGLAACGDDEDETATTPTTTETRGYEPPASDEPFEVEATIEEIGQADDGTIVLTAKSTEGETYEVLVPPDVTLDAPTAEVFNNPDCAGKVLANLELVPAPDHEQDGDHILVTAGIDTESCL